MLYEGMALDLDERQRLVRDLGDNNAMIPRHHGLLATGRTVADTFYEMYYLEQACRLQVAATRRGQEVVPPDSVAEHAAGQFETFESKGQRPVGRPQPAP
jgi:ribulose-5-phosphate 4-epimerase/fuculose-1-phosphate aldolase